MKNCLNENELAQYCDYLHYGTVLADAYIQLHVEGCNKCKLEILEVSILLDAIGLELNSDYTDSNQ